MCPTCTGQLFTCEYKHRFLYNISFKDVPFDYGMKNKDPLRKAYFYRKNNPDKGEPIPKSKVRTRIE